VGGGPLGGRSSGCCEDEGCQVGYTRRQQGRRCYSLIMELVCGFRFSSFTASTALREGEGARNYPDVHLLLLMFVQDLGRPG
jgi:hypothetical protein